MAKNINIISIFFALIYTFIGSSNALALKPEATYLCAPPKTRIFYLEDRLRVAQCLRWEEHAETFCGGQYIDLPYDDKVQEDETLVQVGEVSLFETGTSFLTNNVTVYQKDGVLSADKAHFYRDPKTKEITNIELHGNVQYQEPKYYIRARYAKFNPQDKSGKIEDALYRFKTTMAYARLPAWGRSSYVERFPNEDLLLKKTTYTTCVPSKVGWRLEADSIALDHKEEQGLAKNVVLKVAEMPVFYTPYLSFPTSKKRKSGILLPLAGYSNIGGFEFAVPYYWNMAPNYDSTFTPRGYSLRGLMLSEEFRYLTTNSLGGFRGNFLPQDQAFKKYIKENKSDFPQLDGLSSNRWSVAYKDDTKLSDNWSAHINYEQVSDDYYLQDFSNNLAVLTQNQILREGGLAYAGDHWLLSGRVENYQTLHPVNQSAISDIYSRMPQLSAKGYYYDLPYNLNLDLSGQFDAFRWPNSLTAVPQGPRFNLHPVLSMPLIKTWGYITPSAQLIENYYDVYGAPTDNSSSLNRVIPRFRVDSGLFFERQTRAWNHEWTQTLEPRLYYLKVPYINQTAIPVYDSAYMIFNYDQLFRDNRFSGLDRISDMNQLGYALQSRYLSAESGLEKAFFAVGQLRYFSKRQTQLCYQNIGSCVDNPLMLGYLSPNSALSPLASRATYHLNNAWQVMGDYMWDPATRSTNNGDLNFHYEPSPNHILRFGYSYLVSGNIIALTDNFNNRPLNQATVSYAWPFNDSWSSLGGYGYNISEKYTMTGFFGVQYDNCCWALRLMGGRTFQSLSPYTAKPVYNNNVYLQVLLKGLGSIGQGNPAGLINTYLPGYRGYF